MDATLKQSFLPRRKYQRSEVDKLEYRPVRVIVGNSEEKIHMDFGNFSDGGGLINLGSYPPNGYADYSKQKPHFFNSSLKGIMNSNIKESGSGPVLVHPPSFLQPICNSIQVRSYNLGLPFPLYPPSLNLNKENETITTEMDPQQSALFFMQSANLCEENSFSPHRAVKHKLNPEAKEYVPMALLSKINKNAQTTGDSLGKCPQNRNNNNESATSDFGFIKADVVDSCSKDRNFSNNRPVFKQKVDGIDEPDNKVIMMESSLNLLGTDKFQVNDGKISGKNLGHASTDSVNCSMTSSSKFPELSNSESLLNGKLKTPSESCDTNDESVSNIDCASQETDYSEDESSDADCIDFSDENETVDGDNEFFEGANSDESFIKFGSVDSSDCIFTGVTKTSKENDKPNRETVIENKRNEIFSLLCCSDSDSESDSDEESDYDCDLFSVHIDDGWDLCCGGLQISAIISNSFPKVNSKAASASENLSTVEKFNDCNGECSRILSDICSDDYEILPDIISANERWKEEIDKNLSIRTPSKVEFKDEDEIHLSDDWDRHGPWEQHARDRMRFARRIEDTGTILAKVLMPDHRQNMYTKLTDIKTS